MAYIVNTKSGLIHDESKTHAKSLIGKHFERVDTIPEAKAKAKKNGKPPRACERCGFNQATIEECKL